MKKDIKIPTVNNLQLAIVQEYNSAFKTYDWNAYLVNTKTTAIEMVLIVTKAYSNKQKTATLRHKIAHLPANSAAKIEMLLDDVLQLNNSFKVSFFLNNRLFEKDFLIKKHTVTTSKAQKLELFSGKKGFLFD